MGSGPSTAPRGVQPAVSHGTTSALTFQDLVTMVEQLARFLGVSCDKAQLESLIEHCHQLVDQCCNAEALPVGRGTRPCRPCLCPGPVAPPPHFSVPLPGVLLLQSPLLCVGGSRLEAGPCSCLRCDGANGVWVPRRAPGHVPGSVGTMLSSRCLPRWPHSAEPGWPGR